VEIVACEEFAIGPGADDLCDAVAGGVEPVGCAPAINEFAVDEGGAIASQIGGALGVLSD
jgi:hypothetical protein